MDLPRIPNPEGPVVIPAVAEKQYSDLYIVEFTCSVPLTGEQYITMRTRPYSYDLKEAHPTKPTSVHKEPNPYQLAAIYPLVGHAMGTVALAGGLLLALRKAQKIKEPLDTTLNQANIIANNATMALNQAQAVVDGLSTEATQDEIDTAQATVTTAQATLDAALIAFNAAQTAVNAAQVAVRAIEVQLGAT